MLYDIVYRYLNEYKKMLRAKDIHKRYGTIEVLKGVDISIQAGEIVSIVGPSGSGKSTLLHILGTLDKPDRGEVTLHQINVTGLMGKKLADFRNKHIGFVFQFHHLLPEFSALENVCIPGWLAGTGKTSVKNRAEELLNLLGLGHRLHNKPGALSGGEQQRVAVARALINTPDIVFADEPTGNLDSKRGAEIMAMLEFLSKKQGITVVMVTHDDRLAKRADRRLHIIDGRVIES